MEFDYSLYPGKKLEKKVEYKYNEPVISIITPYYNGDKYIDETVNSVLNQTFPYYEWIIVDDGSTNEESLEKLNEIEKLDSRIRVIHKENGGLADTRDYGANNTNSNTKYLIFLDDDDVIDKTYLECAYWTLETNKGASWAYTDVINFGEQELLWIKWFDCEEEKRNNLLVATALIRKEDFFKVNGYEIKEKAVNEDWNLWLKMIAKGMYPVRMNYLGFWYRVKVAKESERSRAIENAAVSQAILDKTRQTITKSVTAIQYPKQDFDWDKMEEIKSIIVPERKHNEKINLLMIIPWMVMGGADKFNLDLINGLNKEEFSITVICTEPSTNTWRQKFVEAADAVYDLTTFMDRKYWINFIDYIIKKQNINLILNTNSAFGYSAIPYIKSKYSNIPILDYVHMEEWYNRNGGFSRDSSSVQSLIDKTLVCNENSRNILINNFERNEEEVETVYIGVDEKFFNPENYNKKELLKKYNIPNDKKVISYIARVDWQKRPYLLLNIVSELVKERKDIIFIVAGDGPLLKQVKSKAKKVGIEKNIIFLGSIQNTAEVYAVSDITINCSIKEGLALTSYESLSMGIPVVTANVGGQAELIDDTVGVAVPCLQEEAEILNTKYTEKEIKNYVIGINKVLKNLEYYKKNARRRILDKFTINHMIEKMTEIFKYTSKNPNIKKIEAGNSLKLNECITKELITKYFIAFDGEYTWLSAQINENISQPIHVNKRIKQMSKRTIIKKALIKLHIYNEGIIVYKFFKSIYIFLTCIYEFIKNLIYILVDIIKLLGIRFVNLFLKLILRKDAIKYEEHL